MASPVTGTFVTCNCNEAELFAIAQKASLLAAQEQAKQDAVQNPILDPSRMRTLMGAKDGMSVEELANKLRALCGGADLAFVVFCMQIEAVNAQITEKIKGIQELRKMRESINEDLNKVRYTKGLLGTSDSMSVAQMAEKEVGKIPALRPKPIDDSTLEPETYDRDLRSWETEKKEHDAAVAAVNTKAEEIAPGLAQTENEYSLTNSGEVEVESGDNLYRMDGGAKRYDKSKLETEEQRLQSKLEALDSNSEIAMIALNSDINKKGQFVEWLSNMMKRTADAQSGVISNLR